MTLLLVEHSSLEQPDGMALGRGSFLAVLHDCTELAKVLDGLVRAAATACMMNSVLLDTSALGAVIIKLPVMKQAGCRTRSQYVYVCA
jgi:hypothetical protein